MGQRFLRGVYLFFLCSLPYPAHAVIVITEVQALSFMNIAAGTSTTIVTAPGDTNAAVFNATGDVSAAVTVSIVENNVNITTGSGNGAQRKIPITAWTFGGSLTDAGGSGTASFDASGILNNMRIGASATVDANNLAGDYSGTVTLRVVLQ